jgi:hypothetical protein
LTLGLARAEHEVVIVPNVNLDCVAPFWVRPMLFSIHAATGRPARERHLAS